MFLFVIALHILLCLFLVMIILLQPGKGGDVGAAFGGGMGGSQMFGPRGPTSLLQRATTAVAVLFMVTSVTLALFSDKRYRNQSNLEQYVQENKELQGGVLAEPGSEKKDGDDGS